MTNTTTTTNQETTMTDYKLPMREISRPSGTRLTILIDGPHAGEVMVSGINYDSKLTVHAINSKTIVVKASGGKHWAGRGMEWAYHHPQFMIFTITGHVAEADTRYGMTYTVEPLIGFETGRA